MDFDSGSIECSVLSAEANAWYGAGAGAGAEVYVGKIEAQSDYKNMPYPFTDRKIAFTGELTAGSVGADFNVGAKTKLGFHFIVGASGGFKIK